MIIAATMDEAVIIATVPEPWAIFMTEAITAPSISNIKTAAFAGDQFGNGRAYLCGFEHRAKGAAGGRDQNNDAAAHQRNLDDLAQPGQCQLSFGFEHPHRNRRGEQHREIDVAEHGDYDVGELTKRRSLGGVLQQWS